MCPQGHPQLLAPETGPSASAFLPRSPPRAWGRLDRGTLWAGSVCTLDTACALGCILGFIALPVGQRRRAKIPALTSLGRSVAPRLALVPGGWLDRESLPLRGRHRGGLPSFLRTPTPRPSAPAGPLHPRPLLPRVMVTQPLTGWS